ncbi:unnamed protein product [Phytomonas sp. EM1]|nr:unnamed protein product [Phytomonas sp. EM1]|eukprot:CCW65436.1 unnamed protein product [Phytomonas sp. isolate EM1]
MAPSLELGSRRGIVNFLDVTQGSMNSEIPIEEHHVIPFCKVYNGIESAENSIRKRGSDDDSDRMGGVKSLNSILQKSTHSSGSMCSREGFPRAPWASSHLRSSSDEMGRRGWCSFADSCALDVDDMFSRVQSIVTRMRIQNMESEVEKLCARSVGGEQRKRPVSSHRLIPLSGDRKNALKI